MILQGHEGLRPEMADQPGSAALPFVWPLRPPPGLEKRQSDIVGHSRIVPKIQILGCRLARICRWCQAYLGLPQCVGGFRLPRVAWAVCMIAPTHSVC